MAADLNTLDPTFKATVEKLIANCADRGVVIKPFYTLRSAQEQAKLWRQSRDATEIRKTIAELDRAGAIFLSKLITDVGPCHGAWATNALPGFSWHQWGLAVDCFVSENGKAIWDAGHPGYNVYAEEAEKLRLTAGHRWKSRDSVHVQQPTDFSPKLSLAAIDAKMKEMWS